MGASPGQQERSGDRRRRELLRRFGARAERPMIVLAFLWLALLVIDLTVGLNPVLQGVSAAIWLLFIADFALGIAIAPRKLVYLRTNWLTGLSLVLPAARLLRLAPAFRLVLAARAIRSLTLLRLLTALNRGMAAISRSLGQHGLGFLLVLTTVILLAGAAGMAYFERPGGGPEAGSADTDAAGGLNGFGEALWWTAMLLTTLGSEYWPRTVEGRILAWFLAVYALGIFGYLTANVASRFVGRDLSGSEASRPSAVSQELAALRSEVAALRAEMAALIERSDRRASGRPAGDADRPAGGDRRDRGDPEKGPDLRRGTLPATGGGGTDGFAGMGQGVVDRPAGPPQGASLGTDGTAGEERLA